MYSNRQFVIGDDIQLTEGVDRAFSDCEHGVIESFFQMPLGNLTGVKYANIVWDDGSESAIPVGNLEHEDLANDLFEGPIDHDYFEDCDVDDDFLEDML